MAAVYSVGTFTVPGDPSSGNQTVTGLTWSDGGSYTPQALLIFGFRASIDSTLTADAIRFSVGMTDGTRQFCQATSSNDGETSATWSSERAMDAKLICWTTDGTVGGTAVHSSFGSNQFTYNIDDTFPTDFGCSYIAFAGLTNVYVHVSTISTGTGNFSKTGVGFQGDTGFFVLSGRTTINGGAVSNANRSFGMVDNSGGVAGVFHKIRSSQSSNYSWGACSSSVLMARMPDSATTFNDSIGFVSWDSDGYTLNHTVANGSAYYYGALILKGVASKVASTNHQTGTGTWNVTGLTGVTPKCVVAIGDNISTATTSSAVEDAHLSVGAHISTSSRWALDQQMYDVGTISGSAPTEIYTRITSNRAHTWYNRTASNTWTLQGDVEPSSFSNEQVTLNQNDASPSAVFMPIMAMGDTYSAGSNVPLEVLIPKQFGFFPGRA